MLSKLDFSFHALSLGLVLSATIIFFVKYLGFYGIQDVYHYLNLLLFLGLFLGFWDYFRGHSTWLLLNFVCCLYYAGELKQESKNISLISIPSAALSKPKLHDELGAKNFQKVLITNQKIN